MPGGLDRNAIISDNYLEAEPNGFDIFTTDGLIPDITYDTNANITWRERNWLNAVLTAVQFVARVVICFIACAQGAGISMIVTEVNPGAGKVLNGCGTIAAGASAIQTGLSLFGCGAGAV